MIYTLLGKSRSQKLHKGWSILLQEKGGGARANLPGAYAYKMATEDEATWTSTSSVTHENAPPVSGLLSLNLNKPAHEREPAGESSRGVRRWRGKYPYGPLIFIMSSVVGQRYVYLASKGM